MGAITVSAKSGSKKGIIQYGLIIGLCVLLSLVHSAPVPDNDDLAAGNDMASGEVTDSKADPLAAIDESGFNQLANDVQTEETKQVYRTQTQGITMPHFVFTTGPTTLPPIPKITTYVPPMKQTSAKPGDVDYNVDTHGVVTRPADDKKDDRFTTHVPTDPIAELLETTSATPSTTTKEAGTIVDLDKLLNGEEEEAEEEDTTTTSTTTTTEPTTTTTMTTDEGILVGVAEEKVTEKLTETPSSTTNETPSSTTSETPSSTTSETPSSTTTETPSTTTTEEDLEPIADLIPTDAPQTEEPHSETEEPTSSTTTTATPIVVDVVDETFDEGESTTKQPSSTISVVVIVDGEEGLPSSTSTTTTTTEAAPTEEKTTESAKIFPGIIDNGEKEASKYVTPTTPSGDFTTRLQTEEPSAPDPETPMMNPVPQKEQKNATDDGNGLQKIEVSIEYDSEEPTVVVLVDPEEDGADNSTLIGESKQEGLSSGARTGIAIGCIVGFWFILGPLVCLICKMRDKKRDKKEQEERNAREKASNGLVEEMVKAELQKTPNGDHKKAQYKDDAPFDEGEIEPITIGNHSDSLPYIDADANSRDTAL